MNLNIRDFESKLYSQNGEDGILKKLHSLLVGPNKTFIEIGCSDGEENNSRGLLEIGLSGTAVDLKWQALNKYASVVEEHISSGQVNLKCMRLTLNNCHEITTWHGNRPDIFSLDIDSYDFFIMDALLREGFRPSILCLETNSFLSEEPISVDYVERFARYDFQPEYGLYFGASPNAWRHLLIKNGYRCLGMDSSGTNIFFILTKCFDMDNLEIVEPDDVHQKFFEKKYQKNGEELSRILFSNTHLAFMNVGSAEYQASYNTARSEDNPGDSAMFVTTFTKKAYEEVASSLIESFDKKWPKRYELLALSENCNISCPSRRIKTADLIDVAYGLKDFKNRHRFNPGANGHFGKIYNYIFDCVKWSHKVFAVEVAAEYTAAEYLIYIDSDIVTFEDVPSEFLSSLIPPDADIAYMPRQNMYSECSFVIYRLRNPLVRKFIFEHTEAYRSDKVFQLSGWTDCHIFDALVASYSKQSLLKFHDINVGIPRAMHPFINGPLGAFMDHMKGARKSSGKSYGGDLVVKRTESYWQTTGG